MIVAVPPVTMGRVVEHFWTPVDDGNITLVSPELPQQPLNDTLDPDGPEIIVYWKQDEVGVGVGIGKTQDPSTQGDP